MAHVIFGVVMVALGVWGMWAWWPSFGLVMRGLLPFILLAVGLLALASSYNRLGPRGDELED